MKLSIKSLGISCGIFTGVTVGWAVLMKLVGIGSAPYRVVTQFYLNLIPPSIGGLVFGVVLGFIDGLIGGMLLALIYNKIAKV